MEVGRGTHGAMILPPSLEIVQSREGATKKYYFLAVAPILRLRVCGLVVAGPTAFCPFEALTGGAALATLALNSAAALKNEVMAEGTPRYSFPCFFTTPEATRVCNLS